MPVIRLVPSTYTRSNTSRVSVSDSGNMYYNTDHTGSYTTITGYNGNSTYYFYIRGFNFTDVPADATVTDFKVKIKAFRGSDQSSGSNFYLKLASSTSTNNIISDTTLSSALTTNTSGEVYIFPSGDLTWADIVGYGSNFSILIPLRRSGSVAPNVYVYGAEIEVTYTLPSSSNTVFVKVNGNWVEGSNVYVKNGTWETVDTVYKNVSGTWQQQSEITDIFNPDALYLKGI